MMTIDRVTSLIVVILFAACVVAGWYFAPDMPRWLVAILAGWSLLNIVALILKGIVAD